MNWFKTDEVPALSKGSIRAGNTDGGWSVQLIHRHKSGKISTGSALLHNGKVAHWYPGEFGDCIHSPEEKDSVDPIVGWVVCPTATQIVNLIERVEAIIALMGPKETE